MILGLAQREPGVPALEQAAEVVCVLAGVAIAHRIFVAGVGGKHLGAEHAVPTGIDQATPEIKVFPATWDVGVAAHGLPGVTAHKCHGIDVIAPHKHVLLPGVITY